MASIDDRVTTLETDAFGVGSDINSGGPVVTWAGPTTIRQGTVEWSTDAAWSYRTDGVEAWGTVSIELDSVTSGSWPSGAVGGLVELDGFPVGLGFGRYAGDIADVTAGRIDGWIGITPTEVAFSVFGRVTAENLGFAETLAAGDELLIEFRYPVT